MLTAMTLLRGLWSKVGLYLIAAAALATAVLATIACISKAAKTAEKLDVAAGRLKNMERARRVEAEIDAMSDADVAQRLRDRWGKT